jgi:hypothetical protein
MSMENKNDMKNMEEKVKRVVAEVLKEVDFDLEDLLDGDRHELERLVMEIVLSLVDDDEMPYIELMRAVEEEDIDEVLDDNGNFVLN